MLAVITVMLCFLALCYHVLPASITFILVMLDSSTCWVGHVLWCMTNVGYRVPFNMHGSFVVSLISIYSVMLLMCSCMVFIVEANGHVML